MSIKDVAATAGVSVATASRALNNTGRISPATRSRVLAVAKTMGYKPNEIARQLKAGSSSTLGVLVPDITNPFFPELVRGIQEVVEPEGYVVILAQSATKEQALAAIGEMRARRVAGLVVADDQIEPEVLIEALDGLTFVSVDRRLGHRSTTCVISDHRAGAQMATEHLIGLGHRRIAHIAGPQGIGVARERLAGYRAGLDGHGLSFDASLVFESPLDESGGYEAAAALLKRHPRTTAIFAANDLVAIGAMQAADESSRTVPDDLSIVGFDDIHLASYMRPGLTTVRQEVDELGRVAARLLIGQPSAGTEPTVTLPVELVVRGTTAQPATEENR